MTDTYYCARRSLEERGGGTIRRARRIRFILSGPPAAIDRRIFSSLITRQRATRSDRVSIT